MLSATVKPGGSTRLYPGPASVPLITRSPRGGAPFDGEPNLSELWPSQKWHGHLAQLADSHRLELVRVVELGIARGGEHRVVRAQVAVEDETQRVDGVRRLGNRGLLRVGLVERDQALDADLLHCGLPEGALVGLEAFVGLEDDHGRAPGARLNRVDRLEQLPVQVAELLQVVAHTEPRAQVAVGVTWERDRLTVRAEDVRVVRQEC